MRKSSLHICVLLDVSASMSVIKPRVVASLRLFLQERLARSEQTKKLDVYVFAGGCEKILSDVDLESLDFERFDEAFNSVLICKGVTTIQDALCVTIDAFGAKLAALDEDLRPEKVVFVVITDGYDNSSLRFSLEDVKDRISLQTEVYSWRFVFFNAQLYQIYSDCLLNETPSFEPLNDPERVAALVKGKEKKTENVDANEETVEDEAEETDEIDLKTPVDSEVEEESAASDVEADLDESDEIEAEIESELEEPCESELEVETTDNLDALDAELESAASDEIVLEMETPESSEALDDDSELVFSATPESEADSSDDSELVFSALPESEADSSDDSETLDDESILEDVSFESIASQAFESSEDATTNASVFVPLDASDEFFDETSTENQPTFDETRDETNVDVFYPSVPLEENFDVVHFEGASSDEASDDLEQEVAPTDEESAELSDDDPRGEEDDACLWEDYDVEDIKEPFAILPSSNFFTVKTLDSRLRGRDETFIDVESRAPEDDPPESESSDETNQDVANSSEEVDQEGNGLVAEPKRGFVRRLFGSR